jgi:hypothetical protein
VTPRVQCGSLSRTQIWCQRRDSNSQTPVSKTGRYSNSRTLALWCTGKDLNLRVPGGETGLQPVRFSQTHAPVQSWRKVDESNAHGSSPCPGFRDQLPAIQQYLPRLAESVGVEPASKHKFNNIEAHGWHKKHCKDVVIGLTDRRIDRKDHQICRGKFAHYST